MTFEIPKITVAPTVAAAAEGGTPSETDQNAAFVSVDVKKYIGQQTFSLELLDRSIPAFFAELVRQMEFAYAKATDAAVGSALIAGGTDGGNRTLTTGANLALTSFRCSSFYLQGNPWIRTNIIVSPEQWGALMGLGRFFKPSNFPANNQPTKRRRNTYSNSSSRKPTRT
jgi:hypothetical protein